MLNWSEDLLVSVGDLIASNSELGSQSTLQHHIRGLFELGLINYQDSEDRRVKLPVPSAKTVKYYEGITKNFLSIYKNVLKIPVLITMIQKLF
ncbi:helix-turn-helix domain-containing protein [Polynucleobacter necessarius]|uniref:hypothetical protein n=1 Tax=Polynucleobacter necessarius TaxID=576610 RepID=UPI000E0989D5|nr:hypothetical protein [Polynucleobacter necessarius]